MDRFDKLSYATEKYISNAILNDSLNFKMIEKLTNIVLNNELKINRTKYYQYVSLKKSINLSKEFLKTINLNYYNLLENLLKNNNFEFEKKENENAYSDFVEGKSYIYIPYSNNINDAYNIIHEFNHDVNMPNSDIKDDANITRFLFTESLSYLAELLFYDYLKSLKIKEAKKPIIYVFKSVYDVAFDTQFNLDLINKFLEKGILDQNGIYEILSYYGEIDINNIMCNMDEIIEQDFLTLDFKQKYVIGILISTYMYERIKKKKKNIQEYFDMNEIIKKYDIDKILSYLELTYTKDELTNDSYKKLEDSYKKYIKRI